MPEYDTSAILKASLPLWALGSLIELVVSRFQGQGRGGLINPPLLILWPAAYRLIYDYIHTSTYIWIYIYVRQLVRNCHNRFWAIMNSIIVTRVR